MLNTHAEFHLPSKCQILSTVPQSTVPQSLYPGEYHIINFVAQLSLISLNLIFNLLIFTRIRQMTSTYISQGYPQKKTYKSRKKHKQTAT